MNETLFLYCILLLLPNAVYSIFMVSITRSAYFTAKLACSTLMIKSIVLCHEKGVQGSELQIIVGIVVTLAVVDSFLTLVFDMANVLYAVNSAIFWFLNNLQVFIIMSIYLYLIAVTLAILNSARTSLAGI